jgi:hypothetical protein
MLPTSVRIMACTQAQDMRRSFDTLALVVKLPRFGGRFAAYAATSDWCFLS